MKISCKGVRLHVSVSGPDDGAPIVLLHGLGTDLRIWDDLITCLPDGLRIVRFDLRGHGQSDVPAGPYKIGQMISEAETVCDALNIRDCVFVGTSAGGTVAQGLAVKRADIIRGLVLANTAARYGPSAMYAARIARINERGIAAELDTLMGRWFGKNFFGTKAMGQWMDTLMQTSAEAFCATFAAVIAADMTEPVSMLRIPALGIAGGYDGATPPDLMRETMDLIPGSQFALIRHVGHLACAEDPDTFADHLNRFLVQTGHLTGVAS